MYFKPLGELYTCVCGGVVRPCWVKAGRRTCIYFCLIKRCPCCSEQISPLLPAGIMAESRRIQFTTLSCDVALPGSTSAPKPAPGVQQERETRPDLDKVHRLELTLFEPDERCFPEFSYSQLLENKVNPFTFTTFTHPRYQL